MNHILFGVSLDDRGSQKLVVSPLALTCLDLPTQWGARLAEPSVSIVEFMRLATFRTVALVRSVLAKTPAGTAAGTLRKTWAGTLSTLNT